MTARLLIAPSRTRTRRSNDSPVSGLSSLCCSASAALLSWLQVRALSRAADSPWPVVCAAGLSVDARGYDGVASASCPG
jgi:hypothetical protein